MVVESKNNDIENGTVIEKGVSESDTLKIDSETVSESEKIVSCNEVIISAVSYTHLSIARLLNEE